MLVGAEDDVLVVAGEDDGVASALEDSGAGAGRSELPIDGVGDEVAGALAGKLCARRGDAAVGLPEARVPAVDGGLDGCKGNLDSDVEAGKGNSGICGRGSCNDPGLPTALLKGSVLGESC